MSREAASLANGEKVDSKEVREKLGYIASFAKRDR